MNGKLGFLAAEVVPVHINKAQPPIFELRLKLGLLGVVHGEVD